MSEVLPDLKYAPTHEWARLESDGTITIGISDHAQSLLGDLVFVELPQVGDHREEKEECAVVESVKAASDVYAPIAGEIVAVNDALSSEPAKINESPYEEGWILKIKPDNPKDYNALLDYDAYSEYLAQEE
jgi:glycine cleavage system H protein